MLHAILNLYMLYNTLSSSVLRAFDVVHSTLLEKHLKFCILYDTALMLDLTFVKYCKFISVHTSAYNHRVYTCIPILTDECGSIRAKAICN